MKEGQYGLQNRAQNSFLEVLNALGRRGFVVMSPYWKDILVRSNSKTVKLFGDGGSAPGGGTAVLLQKTHSKLDGTYILLDANWYKKDGLMLEVQGKGIEEAWLDKLRNWPGFISVKKTHDSFTESNFWAVNIDTDHVPHPTDRTLFNYQTICHWRARHEDDQYLIQLADNIMQRGAMLLFRFGTLHDMLYFLPTQTGQQNIAALEVF